MYFLWFFKMRLFLTGWLVLLELGLAVYYWSAFAEYLEVITGEQVLE